MYNQARIKFTFAGIIVLLIAGGIILAVTTHKTSNQQIIIDEVTGVWRAEGVTKKDDYKWFVVYSFQNGRYDMKTESPFKDQGTYIISQRFEDKSVKMTKTSETFKKTYDIYITLDPEGKFMIIDGMKLEKQRK